MTFQPPEPTEDSFGHRVLGVKPSCNQPEPFLARIQSPFDVCEFVFPLSHVLGRRQLFEWQNRSGNHMSERINEQIRPLPAIEPEAHLFEVGLEVLCAELVPVTAQTALEQGEGRFDAVGMGSAPHVFFRAVLDYLVPFREAHALCDSTIGRKLIGEENVYILTYVLPDKLFKRAPRNVLGMEEPRLTVPLADADDGALPGSPPALCKTAPPSADVGFINLDLPIEHRLFRFGHCRSNAMAEVPRGFVADSERALNLAGRHAFLRFAQQQRGGEPRSERQMGVIKDRARSNRELIVASLTVEKLPLGFKLDHLFMASRAFHASGPAETRQQLAATVFGREHGVEVN
jgi:hypothetical protein